MIFLSFQGLFNEKFLNFFCVFQKNKKPEALQILCSIISPEDKMKEKFKQPKIVLAVLQGILCFLTGILQITR